MENLDQLKFPIGPFTKQDNYSEEEMASLVKDIENSVVDYKKLAGDLSQDDLSKTYRPGSWNVQQLIHHVADIQMLHFFRMKRALTESDYKNVTLVNLDGWAETKDAIVAPIEDSISMLEAITKRYLYLIKSLSKEQLEVSYFHPLRGIHINQAQAVAMSAWHLKHHLAHISIALNKTY